jgi:C-terminal processing protease CtpA/Prc
MLPAQEKTEKERKEEALRRIQERLEEMRELELAHAQEATERVKERLALLEEQLTVRSEDRLAQAEAYEMARQQAFEAQRSEQGRAMEEARAAFEQAREYQAMTGEEQEKRMAEARARYEHALQLYGERAAEARVKAEEAQARAMARLQEAQQVIVRVKARVRLGVELDANQGEESDGQGARVMGVIEGSPAEEVGLGEGDIITHLNGHSLLDPLSEEGMEAELDEEESLPVQRLMALARELEAGAEVEVRYLRDGQEATVSFEAAEIDQPAIWVTRGDLGERRVLRWDPETRGEWTFKMPEEGVFKLEMPDFEELHLERLKGLEKLDDLEVHIPDIRFEGPQRGALRAWSLRGDAETPFLLNMYGRHSRQGLDVRELNPDLAEYFSTDRGILVLDVDEDSEFGLIPGDVILAIGDRDVEDTGDLWRILSSYEDGEEVTFQVVRKGQATEVSGTVK